MSQPGDAPCITLATFSSYNNYADSYNYTQNYVQVHGHSDSSMWILNILAHARTDYTRPFSPQKTENSRRTLHACLSLNEKRHFFDDIIHQTSLHYNYVER